MGRVGALMKLKHFAALPAIMAVAMAAQSSTALSMDFVIPSGQSEDTLTLTGEGDSLLIELGGGVVSAGNGVNLDAADQSVVNRGAIYTIGTAAYGLQSNAVNASFV